MARPKKEKIILCDEIIKRGEILNVLSPDTTGRYQNINVRAKESFKSEHNVLQLKCIGTNGLGTEKYFNVRLVNNEGRCYGKYKHIPISELSVWLTNTMIKVLDELDWVYA
jgi:hypothetical protein